MIQLRSMILRLLLAFGLGLSLWVYVTFSENPESTATFREMAIRIEGKSPGLVLVDESGQPLPSDTLPARLDLVTVQADTQTLSNLSRTDIDAYIDLTGLGPGDYNRPVLPESKRPDLRLRFREIQPSLIPIRLETVITATVPLSVVVRGSVPFVYERDAAQVDDERASAQVSGPEGLVRQVVQVRATANIEGLTGSFESSLPLDPLDEAGQRVEGVTVTPTAVTVSVPIRPTVGIKPVAVAAPTVIGAPAAGFQVTGISVVPPFVNLTGSSESLAAVESIVPQPLDLSGASESFTRELALLVPEGVSLVANAPRQVRISVSLAPIAQPLTFTSPLPVQVENIGPGLLLRSASPAQLLVEVASDTGGTGSLDVSEAMALVDVAGLGEGSYELTPKIILPAGLRLVGNPPSVTVVLVTPTAPPPTRPPPIPTSEATATAPLAPPEEAPPEPTLPPEPTPPEPTLPPEPTPTIEELPEATPAIEELPP